LTIGSLKKLSSQSENLECQTKLKVYGTAYTYYLEDNADNFPTLIRSGNPTGQLHWLQIVNSYPEHFNYNTNKRESTYCPTFAPSWSSKTNYRGYTGVYNKQINDIANPRKVAVIGDGIKANTTSGYCFWEIININEASISRGTNDSRYRSFHQDDLLHTSNTVNALFADSHTENMDAFYMMNHRDDIWNK